MVVYEQCCECGKLFGVDEEERLPIGSARVCNPCKKIINDLSAVADNNWREEFHPFLPGDEIVVVDASNLGDDVRVGDIGIVNEVFVSGCDVDLNGLWRYVSNNEIQPFSEPAGFKEGDRVVVVDRVPGSPYENGDIGVVTYVYNYYNERIEITFSTGHHARESIPLFAKEIEPCQPPTTKEIDGGAVTFSLTQSGGWMYSDELLKKIEFPN